MSNTKCDLRCMPSVRQSYKTKGALDEVIFIPMRSWNPGTKSRCTT